VSAQHTPSVSDAAESATPMPCAVVPTRTGRSGAAEILSGVVEGDRVILYPSERIVYGSRPTERR
jgi:hypothetical protein